MRSGKQSILLPCQPYYNILIKVTNPSNMEHSFMDFVYKTNFYAKFTAIFNSHETKTSTKFHILSRCWQTMLNKYLMLIRFVDATNTDQVSQFSVSLLLCGTCLSLKLCHLFILEIVSIKLSQNYKSIETCHCLNVKFKQKYLDFHLPWHFISQTEMFPGQMKYTTFCQTWVDRFYLDPNQVKSQLWSKRQTSLKVHCLTF